MGSILLDWMERRDREGEAGRGSRRAAALHTHTAGRQQAVHADVGACVELQTPNSGRRMTVHANDCEADPTRDIADPCSRHRDRRPLRYRWYVS